MMAIVLSRRDFREFDQIISLYTREKGKIEALARGVKKITSKNSGSLEPFSLVEIEIIPGKEIDHIGSVQLVELFKNIRADFDKILAAREAVLLVEQLFSAAEPGIASFNVLAEWLTVLGSASTVNPIILDALVLKLLAHLGFTPQLSVCVRCNTPLAPLFRGGPRIPPRKEGGKVLANTSLSFNITAGGILCDGCTSNSSPGNQIILISGAVLDTLKTILNQNWQTIFSLKLDKKNIFQFHQLIYKFAVFHSGKELKDWQVASRIKDGCG